MEKILFYSAKWGCFSNFAPFQVDWRTNLWPTAEHAYQAEKFWGGYPNIVLSIRMAPSPFVAYDISHANEEYMDPNWDSRKLQVMEAIIRAKRDQHALIRKMLLETEDAELIENSPVDSFWGRGPNGDGENHLGKIWMKLREEMLFIDALRGSSVHV